MIPNKIEEYIHWHIITNINPKAKRLMKSQLKNKQLLAINRKLDTTEYITDNETHDKLKFHDCIYLGKTSKNLNKEETRIKVKQLIKDSIARLKKQKENIS